MCHQLCVIGILRSCVKCISWTKWVMMYYEFNANDRYKMFDLSFIKCSNTVIFFKMPFLEFEIIWMLLQKELFPDFSHVTPAKHNVANHSIYRNWGLHSWDKYSKCNMITQGHKCMDLYMSSRGSPRLIIPPCTQQKGHVTTSSNAKLIRPSTNSLQLFLASLYSPVMLLSDTFITLKYQLKLIIS